ncbi:MAG: helix-turn-helix transcriptional regulator [Treponema sp.]|nr:helix-turn-helix transcriptional regulator [Treponema sp.]
MSEKEEFKPVYLNKAPVKILMRYLKDDEDYESQIMRESEAFFEKYGIYPNGLVLNHNTFDQWYGVAEESAANTQPLEEAPDDYEIEDSDNEIPEIICEFKASSVQGGTAFATPKYEMLIIYNEDYQNKVYQLFYTDSFFTEKDKFTYPIVNMIETGKNIKALADEKKITVLQIQNVCGLGSFQAVYKWFNGKAVPTVDNLGILANLLDVSIDDLLIFDNRKN